MRYAVCCLGILFALIAFKGFICVALAADVDELLKQINKELRQAERNMFSGKRKAATADNTEKRPGITGARQSKWVKWTHKWKGGM